VDGTQRAAEAWEAGYKDTVIAYPGEVTRLTATFDIAGLYVWHCHILEHEDNEMMRPYCVGGQASCPVPIAAP
jgi:FtsP/CotA-like multicopper oxidase with cupredoxin domain